MDLLLAAMVVLLAFLLASTPARNSDVWLHLATGRAIADGSYRFQGDPFTHDAASPWIAHSWLYDLTSYALFHRLGGTVLVLLKATLVALLAVLMVQLGTGRRARSWAVAPVTLALLAMGGRLLLQPALLSIFFLAATLGLLQRARRLRAGAGGWLPAYGPLVLLFVLWANVDDWFLLGPLTVGLYLLGEAAGRNWEPTDLPGLAVAFGAGSLAWLLTPFHVHGFTVPAELGLTTTAQTLKTDPVLHHLFLSPWQAAYFHSGAAWSIPALAYLALAALSALSFLGSGQAWRSWRLPVWLGLFGLSAWHARAVPFFAVAAGPILALNLQDWRPRYRPDRLRREELLLARLGRALGFVLLLGLITASWPGWLQGAPQERRGWSVSADPSLQQAAEQLARWRRDGQLTEQDHGFAFSPEAANYLAYFCPAEKGAVDARLQAPADRAAEYVAVRRALQGQTPSGLAWRDILRARQVTHVVLYDNDWERERAVYQRLLQAGEEWFVIALVGRCAIVGWKDPRQPTASVEKLRWSWAAEAYHPGEAEKAPAEWPGRGPQPAAWWQAFVTARSAGSPDRDRAALLLTQFETLRPSTLVDRQAAWESSRIAAAVGAGSITLSRGLQQALDLYCVQALHGEPERDARGRLTGTAAFAIGARQYYFQQRDDAPPELLWLAIRAARRALHANPDDAHAYLLLGQAYLALSSSTRERGMAQRLPFLARLRSIQAAAAFQQALRGNPDLLPAHAGLANLYQHLDHVDMQATHLREVLRLTQARGRPDGEPPAEWEARLQQLHNQVRQIDEQLRRLQTTYEANSANLSIADRAAFARQRGLPGQALNLLLTSDVASFGRKGAQMELNLLLASGRLQEVREWLQPEQQQLLGDEDYHLLRLLLAAASGDYEQADAELMALQTLAESLIPFPAGKASIRDALALALGRMVLEERLVNQSLAQRAATLYNRGLIVRFMLNLMEPLRKGADLMLLRAFLDLERGETPGAEDLLRRVRGIYSMDQAASVEGAGFALELVEHFLDQLSRR